VGRIGDGSGEERLGQPGHAAEQSVASGEESDQQLVHGAHLTDDAPADLRPQISHPAEERFQRVVVALVQQGHRVSA
jgi:hypothetical protein